MEKRRNCSPLFHNIFNISLTSGVKLHIHLLNVVVRFIVYLSSATLIFRGTEISKCFRESLGIRDNESRLMYPAFPFRPSIIYQAVAITLSSWDSENKTVSSANKKNKYLHLINRKSNKIFAV